MVLFEETNDWTHQHKLEKYDNSKSNILKKKKKKKKNAGLSIYFLLKSDAEVLLPI